MEDSCPNCGYRRKPYLMVSHPGGPGLGGLLRGEGDDPLLVLLARVGILPAVFAVFVGLFALIATTY